MKIAKIKRFSIPLHKLLTVCTCCVFLGSILFPFLAITHYTIIPEDSYPVTYWSYKTTIIHANLGIVTKTETLFFTAYWFAQQKPYSYQTLSTLEVSWVPIAMLSTQILTLWFGFASLFWHSRSMQSLPLMSCLFATFLMTYLAAQIQGYTYVLPKYEVGYWLSYASAIMFLCALILHLVRARSTEI